MKKIICILSSLFLITFLNGQEITKVAVVDLSRINSNFRTDSKLSRDYETKKARYQGEIQKLQAEILELKNKKLDAMQKNKDNKTIKKYDALISSKTKFLVDYTAAKEEELKSILKKLKTSDEYFSAVYNAIKIVAEREGFTAVFNLQENSALIWYSQTIDITNLVIAQLK